MTSPPIGTDEELIAKLRAKIVLQRGEVISIDLLDGKGPRPVTTGETVRLINPDGPEAADALQSRKSEVERLEGLVKGAFIEAWLNGYKVGEESDYGAIEPKTDEIQEWEKSKARAALSQHRTTG